MRGVPVEALRRVPLFADLDDDDLAAVGGVFKERRFAAGETIIQEGSGGAAFFVIESGTVTVLIGGREHSTLGPGDHFGEIALIDDGTRMATIVAAGDVHCYGVTYWDFRPLVEANGVVGWKLLQAMARMLRDARSRTS